MQFDRIVNMKKFLLVLCIAALGMGIVCRFVLLSIPFEYDELFTVITANPALSLGYIWNHYLLVDVHPPLHNLILWVYSHIVPYEGTEWTFRWPSIVLSLMGLFFAWKLFPRYLGKTVRWIFLLLLCSNFYIILYGQHARMYALVLCWAIPLTFLYLQMMRCIHKSRPIHTEWWVWYGALSLLLSWSHYFGALLFGLFSVILCVYAWQRKQPLRWFILVPLAVLLCFLPWLVPNLQINIAKQSFSGQWWNKKPLSWNLLRLWIEFFFGTLKAFYLLIGVALCNIIYTYCKRKKYPKWPHCYEIVWVFIPMALAGSFVLAISPKINWLLWRYFMAFIPCLYLFVALLLTPLCQRKKWMFAVFLYFVGMCFYSFINQYFPPLTHNGVFSSRLAMEIYANAFADKDLYVVSIEAFPTQSMVPMYSFYPRYRFHMQNPVYEVFNIDPATRDQLLSRQDKALIWLPNCAPHKMDRLTRTWQRNMTIFAQAHNNCFIIVADENNRHTIDPHLVNEYTQRFNRFMQNRTN